MKIVCEVCKQPIEIKASKRWMNHETNRDFRTCRKIECLMRARKILKGTDHG